MLVMKTERSLAIAWDVPPTGDKAEVQDSLQHRHRNNSV